MPNCLWYTILHNVKALVSMGGITSTSLAGAYWLGLPKAKNIGCELITMIGCVFGL